MKKSLLAVFFMVVLLGSVAVAASGTIDPTSSGKYKAAFLNAGLMTDTGINFGKFTTEAAYNVTVSDTELRGYAWGGSVGWMVLNCADTVSGCSSANGNFKVANDGTGILSGYAWGENTGWINFGPFAGSTPQVKIAANGNFGGTTGTAGYAWSQNYGWIIFDCSNANTCVNTDWSPVVVTPVTVPVPTLGTVTDTTVSASDTGATGGTGPYTYQWKRGTVSGGPYTNIAGQTGLTLNDSGLTASTDYYYVLQATDSASAIGTSSELHAQTAATSGGGGGGSGSGGGGGSGGTGGTGGTTGPGTGTGTTTPPNENPNPPVTPPTEPPTEPPTTPPTEQPNPPETPEQPSTPPTIAEPNGNPAEQGNPGGLFNNGLQLPPTMVEVANNLSNTVSNAAKNFLNGARSSAGMTTTKIVSAIGAGTTAAAGAALILFANPFSFAELFLLPFRLWTLLLVLLGIKKRNRPWGTVYDSVTKQPIDPAYVVLMDMQGNEVATSITDIDGRYGFSAMPGTYKLMAHKTNYEFPSKKLAGRTGDELYAGLYFGEPVIVEKEGDIIAKNIPLDQLNFDWNEFAKNEQHRLSYYHRSDVLIAHIATIFFWFGFAVAAFGFLTSHGTYNAILLAIYVVMLIIRYYSPSFKPKGSVTSVDGESLSFAIVHVLSAATGQEVTHKVADRLGNYYCLVPNGTYTIAIDKKNPDGSYTKVAVPGTVIVKNGYLKESFKI